MKIVLSNMGNSSSASNDELNCRVKELTMEILGQFQKEFSLSFRDLIVNECNNAASDGSNAVVFNPSARKWHCFRSTQNPTENLRAGHLYKLGHNFKTWKHRYFVVKNIADNYSIVYYSTSAGIENAAERGQIDCCGYQIDSFTDDETEKYGPFGIKLRPFDHSKRIWMLRAETEAIRNEWIETLVNVCKLTAVPLVEDLRWRQAFRSAYQNTRASYGYFLCYKPWGSETQMLHSTTQQILYREILDDDYRESADISRQKRKLDICIDKVVTPVVKSTWNSCVAQARQMADVYKIKVYSALPVIIETQARIEEKLIRKVTALFKGQVTEMNMLFFHPLMEYCNEGILDAFRTAIIGFSEELLVEMNHLESPTIGVISSGKDSNHANQNRQTRMEQNLECASSTNPLANSQKLLWKLFVTNFRDKDKFEDGSTSLPRVNNIIGRASRSDLTYPDILPICRAPTTSHKELQFESGRSISVANSSGTFCNSGLCGSDLYVNVIEDLRELLRNASYTFWKLFRSTKHQRDYASNRFGRRGSANGDKVSSTSVDEGSASGRALSAGEGEEEVDASTLKLAAASSGRLYVIYQDVMKRLGDDAAVSLHHLIKEVLISSVEHRMLEVLLPSCSEIANKEQDVLTEETLNFLSTSSIAEALLRDLLSGAVNKATETFNDQCVQQLSALAKELVKTNAK